MRNSFRHSAILFTVSLAALLAGAGASIAANLVVFEAESGMLGADWGVSNGTPTYITITTDLPGEAPTNASRVASYSVTFSEAGTYNLFCRVRVGTNAFNDDSFYYGNGFGVKSATDAAAWIKCNNLAQGGFTSSSDIVTGSGSAASNVWKWINLSQFTGSSGETPITFTVPPGSLTQTFQIGARENGFDLDKFAFGTTGISFTVSNLDNGNLPLPPSTNAAYEIGTWRGFRSAAISYTFDDDLPNQYSVVVPMFNARGFKLTLFTVPAWVPGGNWTPLKNAALSGHEIASHSVSHTSFSGLSSAQQTNELQNSQTTINANIPNQQCQTFAYPNCVQGIDAIAATYYVAARGCSGQLVPSTPANFMNISSFVCGSQGSIQTAQNFNSMAESAAAAKSWCVYLIHAIDGDSGYSPLSSTVLQASVDYLGTNQSKFWVETFGNVTRYIRERNAASIAQTAVTSDSITLQVTDGLNNSIYNYPITVRRPLPAGWQSASVSQNNQPVSTQIVSVNSTNFVMFDVVPDGGDVVISKIVIPVVISNPLLTPPNSFTFRLDGQVGARYVILSSSNFTDWSPIQTNVLVGTFTNFLIETSNSLQFYRAQWLP